MATKIIIPKFGWMMKDGKIVKWHKQEGDVVAEGDVLFEVTTDKSIMEVESPCGGWLIKILLPEGGTGEVGETVAYIGAEGETVAEISSRAAAAPETSPAASGVEKIPAPPMEKIPASPAAKRLAKENNICIQEAFSGSPERVVKAKDIQKLLAPDNVKITPLAQSIAREENVSCDNVKGSGVQGKILSSDIRASAMRATIASRMSESSRVTAPVTYAAKVNMEAILAVKEKLNTRATGEGIKITVTDLVIKIAANGLVRNQNINATFEDGLIHEHEDVNIGVAVALENGLLVPVIAGANRKSILEIARERSALVMEARKGKLPNGMSPGTFTITNLGNYDIDFFTPIIDIPQTAILGIAKTNREVVAVGDEIGIKPMAWFTLVADHRVIDGAPAAAFLSFLKSILEDPIGYIV